MTGNGQTDITSLGQEQPLQVLIQFQKEILEDVAVGGDFLTVLGSMKREADALLNGESMNFLLLNQLNNQLISSKYLSPKNNREASCSKPINKVPQVICSNASMACWKLLWSWLGQNVEKYLIHMPLVDAEDNVTGVVYIRNGCRSGAGGFNQQVLDICARSIEVLQRRLAHEQTLFRAANYDSLTGVANRHMFRTKLNDAIERASQNGKHIAVLFIDLDHFKIINDTFGHDIGDRVLKRFSEKVDAILHVRHTLARLGGDEFVLTIEDDEAVSSIPEVINLLKRKCMGVYYIENTRITVSASIGVSVYPEDGVTAHLLLGAADEALFKAKSQSRGSFQLSSAGRQLCLCIGRPFRYEASSQYFLSKRASDDGCMSHRDKYTCDILDSAKAVMNELKSHSDLSSSG